MPKASKTGERPLALRILRIALTTLALVVLVVFLGVLAYVTLTPVPGAVGQAGGNTHPGWSIRFYLDRPDIRAAIQELGGNLLLLTPLGALLPLLGARMRNWFTVTLTSAVVSLLIEIVQGVFIVGRAFDIDDVILNTVGALIAYLLLGRVLGRIAAAASARRPASTKRRRRTGSPRGRG